MQQCLANTLFINMVSVIIIFTPTGQKYIVLHKNMGKSRSAYFGDEGSTDKFLAWEEQGAISEVAVSVSCLRRLGQQIHPWKEANRTWRAFLILRGFSKTADHLEATETDPMTATLTTFQSEAQIIYNLSNSNRNSLATFPKFCCIIFIFCKWIFYRKVAANLALGGMMWS